MPCKEMHDEVSGGECNKGGFIFKNPCGLLNSRFQLTQPSLISSLFTLTPNLGCS
jgi:hypothetical protein